MLALNNILLLISFSYMTKAQFRTNFDLQRIERCGPSPKTGPMTLHFINVTKRGGHQYINYDVSTRIPLDENVGINCLIEFAMDGIKYLPMFTIREKYFCKAANQYLGEFWYEIERAAQAAPGICPIPAGRYRVHDQILEYKKVKLQTFPFGKLKFTFKVIDNKHNYATFLCLIAEVVNSDN